MKIFTSFLCLFTFLLSPALAQVDLPITFDDVTVNYDLTDFGGTMSSIVADPTDPSNLVAMVLKDTNSAFWAGTTMGDTGMVNPIPFSMVSTVLTVRVYSPDAGIPILLKVEDASNGAISSELSVNTTVANAWDTLSFDFSGGSPALNLANTYDKISIFFNFGTDGMTAGNKTYYWENVEFVVAPKAQVDLPITFDDTASVDYDLIDFGGNVSSIEVDPADPGNLVGMVLKDTNAALWAGTTMGDMGLATAIPFTATDKTITVRVYSPDAGIPILLKVEDAAIPSVSSEVSVNTTVSNAWETLVFDFSTGAPALDPANTHDKISIFFNFGTDGMTAGNKTYYWDDVEFVAAVLAQVDLPITFDDTASVDYDLVDFGGNMSSIDIDPIDPGNLALMVKKDTNAALWAGTTLGGSGLLNQIPFTAMEKKIQVRVYSPDAGIPILLKVEETANPSQSSEVSVNTTVANAWETLTFDFEFGAPAVSLAVPYDKISIFFNFGTDGATAGNKTYYCDDVEFVLTPLAQVDLPITFEDTATVDYDLVSFGFSTSSIEEDPVNPSNLVGMTVKSDSAALWAGTTMGDGGLANPIAFSVTDTRIQVRVYSPDAGIPVLLKVEDAANGGIFAEVFDTTTIANGWDTLIFDYSMATPALNLANTYDKISIFFNFGTDGATAGEKTYYWDDVELLIGGGVVLDPPALPITFQDTATINYDLVGFGFSEPALAVDPVDPTNLVAMTVKSDSAFVWAGTTMGGTGLASPIPFSATDTKIQVRVYSPDAGIPVLLKVEDASNGGIFSEISVPTTVANAWDTLVFDFTTVVLSNTYDKISIFFNFGTDGATAGEKTYYWDDVVFILGGGVVLDRPELPITFQDTATVNYNLTDFGGNASMIAVDPVNGANLVGMAVKDSTAQTWAGTTMGGSGLENPIPFTATNKRIAVRVYSPAANTPILLKVEDAANGGISTEIIANTTVANSWETLIFDMGAGTPAFNLANTYDKISIFFNFGTSGMMAGQQTYYWDDVELLECQSAIHVTGNPASQTYEAENDITSDASILSPSSVIYKAGSSINLGDDGAGGAADFEVELGAQFEVIALPCGMQ